MGVNKKMAKKVAKQPYKEYITKRGNSYMAVPLFDEKGRFHGTVVYKKQNVDPAQKPEFACYLPHSRFALWG